MQGKVFPIKLSETVNALSEERNEQQNKVGCDWLR
jgi:hypothetical protein